MIQRSWPRWHGASILPRAVCSHWRGASPRPMRRSMPCGCAAKSPACATQARRPPSWRCFPTPPMRSTSSTAPSCWWRRTRRRGRPDVRRTALIVLAWNQWPTTRRCLDSLLATAPFAAEVIVVDNGSSDETPAGLAAYADRLRIVTLPGNLGFVRGMNAGIAAAHADADVVLLNNDLLFTQPDWLERLRDA